MNRFPPKFAQLLADRAQSTYFLTLYTNIPLRLLAIPLLKRMNTEVEAEILPGRFDEARDNLLAGNVTWNMTWSGWPQSEVWRRINLENAVELVSPPDPLLMSNFSCLSWPPIWCPENRSCGPAARRTMR